MTTIKKLSYLLILLASFGYAVSCASGGGASDSSMEMIALDSGLDKKSMSNDVNDGYPGQYRDQGGSVSDYSAYADLEGEQQRELSDSGWLNQRGPAPGSEESPTSNGSSPELPEGGILAAVEDWLVPSAWAQEHNLDNRYIIRNGNIEMEIEDYEKSASEVTNIAQRHGGIVTDSQMEKYGDDTRVGWLTIRVPGEKFQQAFTDLKEIGDVKVQSVSSEDVSTQYIAGVSRMKSLRLEEETLQGMLTDAREIQRNRGLGEAYSVLLDTQRRLSQVTTELQNVEDRINGLADSITRSTIRVHLSERVIAPKIDEADWSVGATIQRAKRDLQRGMDDAASAVMYFLINGLIWWAVWLGILWLAWVHVVRRIWQALMRSIKAEQAGSKATESK